MRHFNNCLNVLMSAVAAKPTSINMIALTKKGTVIDINEYRKLATGSEIAIRSGSQLESGAKRQFSNVKQIVTSIATMQKTDTSEGLSFTKTNLVQPAKTGISFAASNIKLAGSTANVICLSAYLKSARFKNMQTDLGGKLSEINKLLAPALKLRDQANSIYAIDKAGLYNSEGKLDLKSDKWNQLSADISKLKNSRDQLEQLTNAHKEHLKQHSELLKRGEYNSAAVLKSRAALNRESKSIKCASKTVKELQNKVGKFEAGHAAIMYKFPNGATRQEVLNRAQKKMDQFNRAAEKVMSTSGRSVNALLKRSERLAKKMAKNEKLNDKLSDKKDKLKKNKTKPVKKFGKNSARSLSNIFKSATKVNNTDVMKGYSFVTKPLKAGKTVVKVATAPARFAYKHTIKKRICKFKKELKKNIKNKVKTGVKKAAKVTGKQAVKLSKKAAKKTAKTAVKVTKKTAKVTIKAAKYAFQVAKAITKAVIRAMKIAIQAIVKLGAFIIGTVLPAMAAAFTSLFAMISPFLPWIGGIAIIFAAVYISINAVPSFFSSIWDSIVSFFTGDDDEPDTVDLENVKLEDIDVKKIEEEIANGWQIGDVEHGLSDINKDIPVEAKATFYLTSLDFIDKINVATEAYPNDNWGIPCVDYTAPDIPGFHESIQVEENYKEMLSNFMADVRTIHLKSTEDEKAQIFKDNYYRTHTFTTSVEKNVKRSGIEWSAEWETWNSVTVTEDMYNTDPDEEGNNTAYEYSYSTIEIKNKYKKIYETKDHTGKASAGSTVYFSQYLKGTAVNYYVDVMHVTVNILHGDDVMSDDVRNNGQARRWFDAETGSIGEEMGIWDKPNPWLCFEGDSDKSSYISDESFGVAGGGHGVGGGNAIYSMTEDTANETLLNLGLSPNSGQYKTLYYCLTHLGLHYSQALRDRAQYADCSSFIRDAFKSAGVFLTNGGDTAAEECRAQWNNASSDPNCIIVSDKVEEDTSVLQPGDLLFYADDGNPPHRSQVFPDRFKSVTHVAIYVGDGKISDAGSAGTQYRDFWYYSDQGRHIIAIRPNYNKVA